MSDQEPAISTERDKRHDRIDAYTQRMFEAQVAWGRWLGASLLAVNGGVLIAVSQLGADTAKVLITSGVWFLSGVISALLVGFSAWVNYSAHYEQSLVNAHNMAYPENPAKVPLFNQQFITASYVLAVISGLGSLVCVIMGAKSAMTALI